MAQTISYMPYFLSTVVVCGFITTILSNDGLINHVISSLGLEKVQFLMEPGWFRPVYVISEIWQQCGWGSIIYLAALAGVDSQLYEAAAIDGSRKMETADPCKYSRDRTCDFHSASSDSWKASDSRI